MNSTKRKIMVLVMMMVMIVGSAVSAFGPPYWNGDKNFPMAYGKENVSWYVDLSSSYMIEDREGVTLKYNIVTTYDNSDETKINTYTIYLIRNARNDDYDRFVVDPTTGKKHKLDPNAGWQAVPYRSSVIVAAHLGITGYSPYPER